MRIVLANRYFHPDQSATSRMVSSLAFALAEEGFQVTALASRHFHDRCNDTLPARETIRGVEVRRLWTSGFGRRGLAGRAVDYGTFHLTAAAWWLAHARRGDLCVVCSDPPLLSVTSALPIALRGGRLVNWMMDLFPETAVELGMVARAGRLTTRLRDRSLKMAALTICPMGAMTRYLAGRCADGRRVVTVHFWSDGEEIRPVPQEENGLRREWGLEGRFVVGYSGNFGRAHEFETLIEAAERLREHDDIRFLMIGDGQRRAAMEDEVRRRGLGNVLFRPFQPADRLAESLSAADVHIVSLIPALEYCIVPSKVYGVLAAGRPTVFVGDRDGEVASLVRGASCGEAVAPGDAAGLAALLLRLKEAPAERSAMGERARRLLEGEYALRHGVGRWREAISHLLPQDHPARFPSRPKEVAT